MSKLLFALMLSLSLPAHAVLTCHDASVGTNATWYVGQPFYGRGAAFDYCWASGVELTYIRAHFTGLRMREGTSIGGGYDTVTWFGDDADFIANNL